MVGCSRSAITRISVVLPQPDGPMNETKSPSLICRLTLASASTAPSRDWKVSETPRASTVSAAALAARGAPVAGCDGVMRSAAWVAVGGEDASATLCSVGPGRLATRWSIGKY